MRLGNKEYVLASIGLVRAACPAALLSKPENTIPGMPIVINANEDYVIGGYAPKALVVAGAQRREELLNSGVYKSWALIDASIPGLPIKADDAISSSELMTRLQTAVGQKFFGSSASCDGPQINGRIWPYVAEVHPFENYVVVGMKNAQYRQAYLLDPEKREVRLVGGMDACDGEQRMPRTQTGVRYASAPLKPHQRVHWGAKNSELITQVVRNWTNIMSAVNGYLKAIREGQHTPMRPSFYPVDISKDGKVLTPLVSAGILPLDFARWSAPAQAKRSKAKAS